MSRLGIISCYPVYDGLGSIIGIRDSAGTTINSYNYDEWGTVTSKTEAISNPLRFASYRWDNDAQMYLLGARWYDPTLNRFVSVDPHPGDKDDSLSLNEYLYCQNNPINFVDPDGDKRLRITFKAVIKKIRSPWDKLIDKLVEMGVGDAAVYMSNNSKFWRYAMDHPYLVGAGVGVAGGVCFAGASVALGSPVWLFKINGTGISLHGAYRMFVSRGITSAQVANLLNNGTKFQYFHQGLWKTGFYDASSKMMIAVYNNTIFTALKNVTQSYINNLKGK